MYDPTTEIDSDGRCEWPVAETNDGIIECGAYASWHSYPGQDVPVWVECEEGHKYTVEGMDDGVPIITELKVRPEVSGYGRPPTPPFQAAIDALLDNEPF